MRLRKNKHPFTLVELIAALAVMGFLMLIVGTASMVFYNAWRVSVAETGRLREFRAIDASVGLFRSMLPFRWDDDENDTESDLVFDGAADSIFFTARRRNYGTAPGAILFVRIRLDGSDLVAEVSPYPRFPWRDDDPELPWTREVLSSKVRSLKFRYADHNDSREVEWLDEWDREETPVLPLAVRMTVEWEDGTSESWLRRTTGTSSNSVFLDREEVTANDSSTNANP